MMSNIEIVTKYINVTENQYTKIQQMYDIYAFWNNKINLISRNDFNNFYEHHVLHSLTISHYFKFANDERIIDIGTGGGFPGIPLAIYFSNVHFILVDSIGKKIKIVKDIVDSLQLNNIEVICSRVENLNLHCDYALGRAVSHVDNFLKLTKNISNRVLYLNGSNILPCSACCKTVSFNLYEYFREPFFESKQLIYSKFAD